MFSFDPIHPNIQATLYKRIKALSREGSFSPLSPRTDSPDYMMTRACWAKATAAVVDPDSDTRELLRLSSAFKDNQPLNKPLASQDSLYTNDKSATYRPHTGITQIQTSFKNASIQDVSIQWKLWDINQFKKFQQGFLRHGVTVLVEFGWTTNELLNVSQPKDNDSIIDFYRFLEKKVNEGGGDYHAAIGVVKSFTWNIGPTGEFDCTTTLTSMGNTLFQGTVDSSTEGATPDKLSGDDLKKESAAIKKSNIRFETYIETIEDKIKEAQLSGYDRDCYHDGKVGYCTWGWFEDEVLNTFHSYTTTRADGKDTTSIRSLDFKFKISTEGEELDKEEKETTCRYSTDLWTFNKDIILPNRIIALNKLNKVSPKETGATLDQAIQYQRTFQTYTQINNKFRNFNEDGRGIIRRFVFSSDFLKTHFKGIRDVKSGLNSLWSDVSSTYGGYWSFTVVQSQNDNGKIGVIDDYSTEKKLTNYNPFTEIGASKGVIVNSQNIENFEDKTFVFPVFSYRSLFKDFSVNVKMSSQMATQAMFHSQKSRKEVGEAGQNKPEDLGLTALGLLQNQDFTEQDEENPKENPILSVTTPASLGKKKIRVGKKNAFSKLTETLFTDADAETRLKEEEETEKELETNLKFEKDSTAINWFDNRTEKQQNQIIYTPSGDMLSPFKRGALYYLNNKKGAKKNVDPLVPLSIDFTMMGIGGIRLYDLFAVDYLPAEYRDFCLFQVSGLEHTISPNGWETKVTGTMRVDMDYLLEKKGKIVDDREEEIDTDTSNTFLQDVLKREAEAKAKEEKEAEKE